MLIEFFFFPFFFPSYCHFVVHRIVSDGCNQSYFLIFYVVLLLLLLLLLIWVFHISVSWWSFSGDWVAASLLKSPGLFSVFWAVFNNAVVRMVSTRTLLSIPSRPFNNPLVTVSKAPVTIGINVTFMFGGARGVVIIAVGNEHGDTSSNPGRDWLHFT